MAQKKRNVARGRKNSRKGDRRHQSSLLTKMVGLLNNLVGIIIYIVMSLPLSILWIVRNILRWSLKGISFRRNQQRRLEQNRQLISEQSARSDRLFISPQSVNIFDIFDKTSKLRIPITRELEIMIMDCRKKWMCIEVSRERINLQRAKEATRSLYAALGLSEPEIVFASSPYEALQQIIDLQINLQEQSLKTSIESKLKADNIPISGLRQWSMLLNHSNNNGVDWNLHLQKKMMQQIIARQIGIKIIENNGFVSENYSLYLSYLVNHQLNTNCIMPYLWSDVAAWLDFQSNALKVIDSQKVSYHFWKVIQECGWIFPFKNLCIVCDRPRKMNLDNQHRLHAEGEPAVEYADGFSIYAYQGLGLPEKYGKINSEKWRSQWILEERNAELRRVLIQGIGYDRICQELSSQTLNSWKEYTLLRIADNIDRRGEIILLKMTCPSTGHIHALRVPPHMRSAREAIRWVNRGIDPEEFSVQT
ncbi:MAG: DUF6745 domain-containing protein [Hormoscilla sp.]